LIAANVVSVMAAAAAEKPTDPVVELAKRLGDAASPQEQDQLLKTVPDTSRGKPLRDAIMDREYQIGFLGEYTEAERLCLLVERLAQEANDPQDLARGQVLHSSVLRELGDYRATLAMLDRALSYYEQHPGDPGIVGAYQGRGITFLYGGDFSRALVNLNQALAAAERLKFREGIIPALNSIGEVYREQGLPERALDFYAKARAVVADDNAWNMAFIFNNIGQAYDAMRDRGKAVEFIEKARVVAEKNKMRPRVATSLAVLAKIAVDEQRFSDAWALYQKSLRLSRELRDAASEGRALLGLAEVARRSSHPDEGLARAEEAIAVFRKSGQPDRLVAALTSAGRCLRAGGAAEDARRRFEEAIAVIEQLRSRIAGGESEAEAFFEGRIAPYDEMTSLLVEQQQTFAALAMAERASARVLLDVLARGGTQLSDETLSAAETARERDLDRDIAELNRRLSRAYGAEHRNEGELTVLADRLREAHHARENFDAEITAAHPELKRGSPATPIASLDALTPLISDGRTSVLKFDVTDERCYLFIIGRGDNAKPQLQVLTLEISRAELANRVAAFRESLANRSLDWQKPARELYNLIFRPAEALLEAGRLVIAPDGPLWELPFRTLLDDQKRAVAERVAISVTPSLSTLLQQAERKPETASDKLVVFANPAVAPKGNTLAEATTSLLHTTWAPLPQMERQARVLEQLYPRGKVRAFIGEAAREQTAKRELPDAGTIEFATHGVLNDRSPLYSYLLLSQRDLAPNEDGLLEARELLRMQLRARLAILCGCETARGQLGAGEGMVGLSWALLVAGCPSIIVSQWKVDEAATTPLMLALHKELLAGTPRAEALRRAMLELRKDERYRHPFYWAPFMLIGDPR
jgi:CHAT domain-containing protein/tetratricopeptide (TPR) repeat protein